MEGNVGNPGVSNNNNDKLSHIVFTSPVDALHLRMIPATNYALRGVLNTVPVLFQLKTDKLEEEKKEKRKPMDLCVCLDHSGSMSGMKLDQSKQTIKRIIENMDAEDRFHLVGYSSDVTTLIENGNPLHKDELHALVNKVQATGGTNMGIGLERASQVLTNQKHSDRILRMLLFSDGLVNEGKRSREELYQMTRQIKEKGITVTTFGIGSDFDEDLMKGIAENGHGLYFYIERPDQIDHFVTTVFGSLMSVIATDGHLSLRGKNGTLVTKISDCPDLTKGVPLGDIRQNDLKNIVAELAVTPKDNVEEEEVLDWEFSYCRKDKQKVTANGKLTMKYTDKSQLCEEKNEEVVVSSLIQRMAANDNLVIKALENRDFKTAQELRGKEIEEMKVWREKDKTGRIGALIKKSENSLEDIKSKKDQKHLVKQAKLHQKVKMYDQASYWDES